MNVRTWCTTLARSNARKDWRFMRRTARRNSCKKLVELNQQRKGRLPEKSIRAIYREIISAALALEQDLRIGYLGPAGSWTHQAAISRFGNSVLYLPEASTEDVFRARGHCRRRTTACCPSSTHRRRGASHAGSSGGLPSPDLFPVPLAHGDRAYVQWTEGYGGLHLRTSAGHCAVPQVAAR